MPSIFNFKEGAPTTLFSSNAAYAHIGRGGAANIATTRSTAKAPSASSAAASIRSSLSSRSSSSSSTSSSSSSSSSRSISSAGSPSITPAAPLPPPAGSRAIRSLPSGSTAGPISTGVAAPSPSGSRGKAAAAASRKALGGRGGAGNTRPSAERAIFSFDEELEHSRSWDQSLPPVYHIGRGGGGNMFGGRRDNGW